MNRIIFLFLFLLCLGFLRNVFSQEENFNYCQKVAPWEDFIIDSSFEESKSRILVVTNRPYLPDKEEFLENDIEHWRLVTYFLAYCESDKWHLTYIDNIQTGLDSINSGGDILLFIHGNGKTFPEALNRASQVHERYKISTILFDWPSNNKNYNHSQARVRHCGENFYNLILQLKDYRSSSMDSTQHVSIFAHSLGNYFLSHLVVNGNNQYMNEVFIDNIILNAAAITSKDQGKVLSKLNFQEQVFVVLNENDRVLRGVHLLTYRKMLGNFNLPPLAPNTEYIHFTNVAGKQHTYFAGYHQFEYDNPAIFDFYNTVMHGGLVDFDKKNFYQLRSSLYDGYDIVP